MKTMWSGLVALSLAVSNVSAAPESQLIGIGRAIKRGVTKTIEDDVKRLLRDGVRCVFDDEDCIARAERDGHPVVLTGDRGDPLLDDEGRPITNSRQPGGDGGSSDAPGRPSYDFSTAPVGLRAAVGRELKTNTPEIARHRDAAMVAASAHYGANRRSLDPRDAYASALHAARVYQSLDEIRQALGEHVEVAPVVTAITGLQFYVLDEGERQVVAIRGTRPDVLRNWVANLIVRGAPDDLLRFDVHEGFLFASRVIQAALVARLDQRRPVHLTGHSLGGSLATLLALRLDLLGYRVSVTTFGAPKITTFAAVANEPRLHELALTRLVNTGDMVYHFPPTMDTTGRRIYGQFGREWMLGPDGTCAPSALTASLRRSATMMLDENLPDWSIEEHGMETYVARLANLVERDGACGTDREG